MTHFPPCDTYCGQVTVDEMVKTIKNYSDKAVSNESLYLFGNGDGGGGPLREHLVCERAIEKRRGSDSMIAR